MTIAVDLGRKATKQTKLKTNNVAVYADPAPVANTKPFSKHAQQSSGVRGIWSSPNQRTMSGRYLSTSEMPIEWRFAGGQIVVRFLLTG